MDVKVTGSTPVYHPNANDESNRTIATKGEKRAEKIRVRGKPTEEGGNSASIYKKAEKTELSTTKGGESPTNEQERGRGIYNGGGA